MRFIFGIGYVCVDDEDAIFSLQCDCVCPSGIRLCRAGSYGFRGGWFLSISGGLSLSRQEALSDLLKHGSALLGRRLVRLLLHLHVLGDLLGQEARLQIELVLLLRQ